MPNADRMTSQLMYLPGIIGKLGINIAEAQKALNADYIETLHKVFHLLQYYAHKRGDTGELSQETKGEYVAELQRILPALAPSRYQFTEATVDFHADLAESKDLGIDASIGFGMGGIALGAGLSLAYGYDYRAAARITAKMHAYTLDEAKQQALLTRAKELHAVKGDLPPQTQVDTNVLEAAREALERMTGEDIPAIPSE